MSRTGRGLFSENGWSDENSDDEKQLSGRGLQSDSLAESVITDFGRRRLSVVNR